MKWFLYELVQDSQTKKLYYKKVRTIRGKWAAGAFQEYATKHNFTQLHKDQTLIGGYFSKPSTGDCLMCVPSTMDVNKVYPIQGADK